jgi:phosphoserine phosphatase RsbU/P
VDQKSSLLIVDDSEANRDMLSRRLQRKGYGVTVAEGGRRALELIAQQRFDLVLLDIVMPDISGMEVLQTLRQTWSAADLPVIMVTAKDESEDIVSGLKSGANDYVTKPLDLPVVLARVQTQLSLKRAVDQIKLLESDLEQRNRELESTNGRLAAANHELTVANERMRRDLEAAARVQQALLPSAVPSGMGTIFAWLYKPCAELGGDILNVIPLDDQNVGMYVLDVVGHGVAAALLSVTVSRVLLPSGESSAFLVHKVAGNGYHIVPPAEVAARLNERFPWDSNTGQFFTIFYGVLNLPTRTFRFVSAGHPPPIYLARGAAAAAVLSGTEGLPIGLGEDGYEERTVAMHSGDRLFLYSDGLTEAMDGANKLFGTDCLVKTLNQSRGLPLKESLASLWQDVETWCEGARPHDDITMLALEITDQRA